MTHSHLLLISVVYILQRPYYLNRVDHDWKIRNGMQKMDIRKYSFVNRTIRLWNKLPMNALGNFPFNQSIFRKRVGKLISEGNSK